MHIFWIYPVITYTEFTNLITINNYSEIYNMFNKYNLYMVIFICCYYFIQNYIYTKRVLGIDNIA